MRADEPSGSGCDGSRHSLGGAPADPDGRLSAPDAGGTRAVIAHCVLPGRWMPVRHTIRVRAEGCARQRRTRRRSVPSAGSGRVHDDLSPIFGARGTIRVRTERGLSRARRACGAVDGSRAKHGEALPERHRPYASLHQRGLSHRRCRADVMHGRAGMLDVDSRLPRRVLRKEARCAFGRGRAAPVSGRRCGLKPRGPVRCSDAASNAP